jgi:hypothetical protein
MRMHPNETLLIIHQEQAERRRQSAESALRIGGERRRREAPPADVISRAFGRPALSHPLRPWVSADAEG